MIGPEHIWRPVKITSLFEYGNGVTDRGFMRKSVLHVVSSWFAVRCLFPPRFLSENVSYAVGYIAGSVEGLGLVWLRPAMAMHCFSVFTIGFGVAGSDVSLENGIDSWLSLYPSSTPAFVLIGVPFLHSVLLQKYKTSIS